MATSLNEIAAASGVGVRLVEKAIPVPAEVGNACSMLGLDPLPARADLNPVVTGTLERLECRVEKVHFQSLPGLYVTGSLQQSGSRVTHGECERQQGLSGSGSDEVGHDPDGGDHISDRDGS